MCEEASATAMKLSGAWSLVSVERGVVKLAEGQAVWHHGLAARVPIGQDVGGLE